MHIILTLWIVGVYGGSTSTCLKNCRKMKLLGLTTASCIIENGIKVRCADILKTDVPPPPSTDLPLTPAPSTTTTTTSTSTTTSPTTTTSTTSTTTTLRRRSTTTRRKTTSTRSSTTTTTTRRIKSTTTEKIKGYVQIDISVEGEDCYQTCLRQEMRNRITCNKTECSKIIQNSPSPASIPTKVKGIFLKKY